MMHAERSLKHVLLPELLNGKFIVDFLNLSISFAYSLCVRYIAFLQSMQCI